MKNLTHSNRKSNSSNTQSGNGMTIVVQNSSSLLNTALMLSTTFAALTMTYISYRQSKQKQGQPVQQQTMLKTREQQELHEILDELFNDQELRDLCFNLSVDYEDLPFSGQSNKARKLIGLCMRHGRLAQLKAAILAERPSLSTTFKSSKLSAQVKKQSNGKTGKQPFFKPLLSNVQSVAH